MVSAAKFKRNLKSFNQIKNLTSKIRKLTKNKKFPIIIDEEGQSVSRLENLISHNISANFFGNLFILIDVCFSTVILIPSGISKFIS